VHFPWLAHDEALGPYITIPQYRFNKTKQHTLPLRSRPFQIFPHSDLSFLWIFSNRVTLTFFLKLHPHTCLKAHFVILFRMRTDSDCLFLLVCVRVCASVSMSVCMCLCAAHCIKRERIKKEIDQIVKSGEFFSDFQKSQQVNTTVSHSGASSTCTLTFHKHIFARKDMQSHVVATISRLPGAQRRSQPRRCRAPHSYDQMPGIFAERLLRALGPRRAKKICEPIDLRQGVPVIRFLRPATSQVACFCAVQRCRSRQTWKTLGQNNRSRKSGERGVLKILKVNLNWFKLEQTLQLEAWSVVKKSPIFGGHFPKETYHFREPEKL